MTTKNASTRRLDAGSVVRLMRRNVERGSKQTRGTSALWAKATSPYESFDVEDGDMTTEKGSTDEKSDAGREEEAQASGTLTSVVALIVGSTVGAGILALPASTAEAGILPASGALFAIWSLLLCDALLLAEVNVALMRERDEDRLQHGRGHSSVVISLADMASATLGGEGKFAVSSLYSFMSLVVLTAYISKAAELLAPSLNLDAPTAATMFTVALGGTICFGGAKTADALNQTLTYGLLLSFALLVGSGTYYADWSQANWIGTPEAAPKTIPIIFLTLVYHDLIPVICSFLDGDMKKIRQGIVIGSSIPLAMFLCWNAVALCLAGGDPTVDPLAIISDDMGGAASLLLSGFGLAALGTSFIGSSISLSEYLMPHMDNTLSDLQEPSGKYALGRAFYRVLDKYEDEKSSALPSPARILTFTAMLSIPLVIADTLPDIFLPVSNFVGAYGMSVMYGILPPLMAWKMRTGRSKSHARRTPVHLKMNTLIPGGRWSLGALGASAVVIALSQVAEDITSSGVVASIPTVAGSSGLIAPLVADIASSTQQ